MNRKSCSVPHTDLLPPTVREWDMLVLKDNPNERQDKEPEKSLSESWLHYLYLTMGKSQHLFDLQWAHPQKQVILRIKWHICKNAWHMVSPLFIATIFTSFCVIIWLVSVSPLISQLQENVDCVFLGSLLCLLSLAKYLAHARCLLRQLYDKRELLGSWLRIYSQAASLGSPDNSPGLGLTIWSMVSWRILRWHLEPVGTGYADRLLTPAVVEDVEYLLTSVCVVKTSSLCQIFPAQIGLLYNSWIELFQEDWSYQMSDLKISSITSGMFLWLRDKKMPRTMLCKEAGSIPLLYLPVSMNSLCGNVNFLNQLVRASRPLILQQVYPMTRKNFAIRFPPTLTAAALLTRVILWVCLLRPVSVKCESVLGCSTGTAV